ncbi:MAG: hypothetical protein K0R92_2924, partial [Lachnospiraceae bacterium]|nr:hypothetical protein [Lachnospiraceae bacterium]
LYNAHEVALNLGVNCISSCCNLCNESCGARCNHSAHGAEKIAVTESVEIVPEYIETVSEAAETVIEESESVISERECGNCKYDDMDPDKYRTDHPDTKEFPCNNCDDKFNYWVPKIVKPDQTDILLCDTCAREVQGCCDYPNTKDDYCVKGNKWQPKESDQVETVEADIIQTEPEVLPKPAFTAKHHLQEAIKREEDQITQMRDSWSKSNPDALLKHETILLALKLHLTDMEYPIPERVQPAQPELPILKNNDQRKEFIDNYKSWPVWIDLPQTGEKYYRYNLTDNVAIVVKVSRKHAWERYKETKDFEYAAEQYYLLGIKTTYSTSQKGIFTLDESRTFYECNTNKSTIVEYLKEFQKKE